MGETPMGAFQMMGQVLVSIYSLGKHGNLKGWLFLGPRRGSQTLKGYAYLGLGGMWRKKTFVGLLLVHMRSPQAPQIKVLGFLMGTLLRNCIFLLLCTSDEHLCTSEFKDVRILQTMLD